VLGAFAQRGGGPAGGCGGPPAGDFPDQLCGGSRHGGFRTAEGTKYEWGAGRDVAFEVDGYQPESGEAWSVVVKGLAREIKQMHEALEALELPLFPWHASSKPHIVRIEPEAITGRRFRVADAPARHPAHEG
jgi:hypothetical protein